MKAWRSKVGEPTACVAAARTAPGGHQFAFNWFISAVELALPDELVSAGAALAEVYDEEQGLEDCLAAWRATDPQIGDLTARLDLPRLESALPAVAWKIMETTFE